MSRPELASFRKLLRLCRHFDREPTWQLGLVGRPPRKYDWYQHRVVRTRFQVSPFAEEMVWEASGLSTQFALPGKHSGAVARACRRHFRRATAMGLPYQSEATQLLKRFEEAKKLIQDLGDWDTAETSDLQLLKSFDCGGHQQVQRGDLLLAHPMSCIRDPNFDQATVLISDVGEDYVSGFVVNKPLRNSTLQQLLSNRKGSQSSEDKDWAEAIRDHSALEKLIVWRGGPIIVGASL